MKLFNYMKDVSAEMKHVSWSTKRQVANFTALVIAVSLLTAYFLGFFDFVFGKLLSVFL